MIGASSKENEEIAKKWLAENNPNDLTVSGGWFKNLKYEEKRWVPYNGGVSVRQLEWLDGVLKQSKLKDEKVVIFCHQPIINPYKPKCLVWNCYDVINLISSFDNVVLWMAGHDHDGIYLQDKNGVHHLIPPAPLECQVGEDAYGHVSYSILNQFTYSDINDI
jgi:hypothetical protein